MHKFIFFLTTVFFSIPSLSQPLVSPLAQTSISPLVQAPSIRTILYCEQDDDADLWYSAGIGYTQGPNNTTIYTLYVVHNNYDTGKASLTNRVQVFPTGWGYEDSFGTAKLDTYPTYMSDTYKAILSTITDGMSGNSGVIRNMTCFPGGWLSYDDVVFPQSPQILK